VGDQKRKIMPVRSIDAVPSALTDKNGTMSFYVLNEFSSFHFAKGKCFVVALSI
jgi:hypothetical protein